MLKLDRYLAREFLQAVFATLVVLLMVMVGGAFMDVLRQVASGQIPAGLMLSQLGLVMLGWMPLILPLALMLGILLGVSRLYRDAEMPVLASVGIGPRRLLRPLLLVVVPIVAIIALCSLWLGPWADRYSQVLVKEANKTLLITGLEPGKFTGLPNGGGVVYVGNMTPDGSSFDRVFIYREKKGRLDVTTAPAGTLKLDGSRARYLQLKDGFEVEGPIDTGTMDFRMLKYATNDVRMPDREDAEADADVRRQSTLALLASPTREARAQLHWRITPPLLALALALLAVPLARSPPRQARYGRLVTGFLGYFVATDLMILGTQWLARGRIPMGLGLWWLTVPLLAFAAWLYLRDGQLRRPRQ